MSAASPDPHRPVAHLRPSRNWINDPNGLAFHDGHYHVFHQYNPYGSDHANMHWGHFRSTDLLTWELLPIALAPAPGGVEADGCFSGNAISAGPCPGELCGGRSREHVLAEGGRDGPGSAAR